MTQSDDSTGVARHIEPVDRFVGAQIKALRRSHNLTQKDLARELGVTFQQIQKYERGENRVAASMLARAALVLNCRVGDLFPNDSSPAGSATVRSDDDHSELLQLVSLMSASRRGLLLDVARQFAALDLKG